MLKFKIGTLKAIIEVNGEGMHIAMLKHHKTVLSSSDVSIPTFTELAKKILIASKVSLPEGKWIVADVEGNEATFQKIND